MKKIVVIKGPQIRCLDQSESSVRGFTKVLENTSLVVHEARSMNCEYALDFVM